MKLKLPSPVQIKGPNGETIDVSARDIVEHMVTHGREFGQSGDLEKVRQGARLLAAVDGADVLPDDLTALRAALAKPSRGWASIPIDVTVRVAPSEQNPTGIAKQRRHFAPSAIEILPLIDGLLAL